MFISITYSVIIVMRSADCTPSGPFYVIWMIDRWAGLAHAPQMCCFSTLLGVLSMFRVYSLNY